VLNHFLVPLDIRLCDERWIVRDICFQFIEHNPRLIPIARTDNNLTAALLFRPKQMAQGQAGNETSLPILSRNAIQPRPYNPIPIRISRVPSLDNFSLPRAHLEQFTFENPGCDA